MEARKVAIANKIFARVLKEITPDKMEVEATIANANRIIGKLKKIVPKDVTLVTVGSITRSTNLKGDSDIDIFMLFNKNVKEERLKKSGLEYAKRIVDRKKNERYEIKYAEHPYVRLYLNDMAMKMDIVPAYKIESIEEMATSVDRTPLHMEFLAKRLSDAQRNDIRLLKYLLKVHNIYGAEVKVKGFPGYLCELLVYHYGSILSLFENAANFSLPIYINPKEKRSVGSEEVFKKFNSRFVVIDPVDPNRNVAAGVSLESLARFVLIVRSFIEKPSIDAFYLKGFSSQKAHSLLKELLTKTGLNSYLIVARVPPKTEDVIWPQLNKFSEIIVSSVQKLGFEIFLNGVWLSGSRGFILYLAPEKQLKTRLFLGPNVLIKGRAAEAFLKAHKNAVGISFSQDKMFAIDFNRYGKIEDIMRDLVNGKLFGRRKDINLKGSKLFVNSVPREYSETVYANLINRLRL